MLEKCCGTRKAHDRAVYARIFIAIDTSSTAAIRSLT